MAEDWITSEVIRALQTLVAVMPHRFGNIQINHLGTARFMGFSQDDEDVVLTTVAQSALLFVKEVCDRT